MFYLPAAATGITQQSSFSFPPSFFLPPHLSFQTFSLLLLNGLLSPLHGTLIPRKNRREKGGLFFFLQQQSSGAWLGLSAIGRRDKDVFSRRNDKRLFRKQFDGGNRFVAHHHAEGFFSLLFAVPNIANKEICFPLLPKSRAAFLSQTKIAFSVCTKQKFRFVPYFPTFGQKIKRRLRSPANCTNA